MHRTLLLTLIIILVGWFPPAGAQAQSPPESLNILLVVDDSGSMQDNDGQNLRLVAAKLLISLLEPQDQVAVVRFADTSQILIPFTAMDPDAKRDLIAKLDRGFQSSGGTDIRAALAQAGELMAQAPGGRGRVVFMTDGLPSITNWQSREPTPQELEAYFQATLAMAEEIECPVLAVALGDEADREFLRAISQVSMGHYFEAVTALGLPAIYLELLSELQDRTVVGPGRLATPGQARLEVHPYAQSVAFVVVKDPQVTTALFPPDTEKALDPGMPGVVSFSEPQFDVVIVPELQPGAWRLALDGTGQADVKAIVIRSRLQLDLVSPDQGKACVGQPWLISASLLVEDGGNLVPIPSDDAPQHLGAQITLPDGQVKTMTLRDESSKGVYTDLFTDTHQPGTYQIVLQASIVGLETRRTVEVTGQGCPGLAILSPPDGASLEVMQDEPIEVEVHLVGGEGQPPDQGEVVALVKDASGDQVALILADVGDSRYRGTYLPKGSGTIEVQARLENAVWQGLPLQAEAGPVQARLTLIPPDPWARYRKLGWVALALAGLLTLLLMIRRARQPKLDGELVYGLPRERPHYEPVRGRTVCFRMEEGYLVLGRGRRRMQGMLQAERDGYVRLLPLNGAPLIRNNVPVQQAGNLLGPRDVVRLEGLEIRYENYKKE